MTVSNYQCRACGKTKFNSLVYLDEKKELMLRKYDEAYYGGSLLEIFALSDFVLINCTSCEHIQYAQEFSDEKLAAMYAAHAKHREGRQGTKKQSRIDDIDPSIKRLLVTLGRKFGSGAKLLDYGAGGGVWSDAAAKLGFNVVAYEPHSFRVNPNVHHVSQWKEVESEKFDVIICNQVLEHLTNPIEATERMRAVSHKDTLFFVAVPNARMESFQRVAQSWPYSGDGNHVVAPFQHLQGFGMKSFLSLMTRQELCVDIGAHIRLGPVGWRRLIQLALGKFLKRWGTTALILRRTF